MSHATRGQALPRRERFRFAVLAGPLAVAVVIIGAVVLGLWSIWSQAPAGPAPHALAGHELSDQTVGADALAEINQLHGTDIPDVVAGWVAHYHDNGTVWLAAANDDASAKKLLDEMVTGIQKGTSPFRGLKSLQYQGQPVYQVSDGQQTHFFYQRGFEVIWLAAPVGSEQPFLAAAWSELG